MTRGVSPNLLERVGTAIIGIAVVLAPLCLGATGVWARFWLSVGGAVAISLWVCSGRRPLRHVLFPLLLLSVALLQIAALPEGLVRGLAPVSAGAWKIAHQGYPELSGSISIAPGVTFAAARKLFLGIGIVAVVAAIASQAPLRRWLIGALCTAGVMIWSLGLMFPGGQGKEQVLLGFISFKGPIEWWKDPIDLPVQNHGVGYWETVKAGPLQYDTIDWGLSDGFGPYVISNHFACGLYLTLPFILSAWLAFAKKKVPQSVRYAVLTGAMVAALWTVGPLAKSRAGFVALALASVVFLALVAESRWVRVASAVGAGVFLAGVLAATTVLYGPFDAPDRWFPERLQPMVAAALKDGRVEFVRVALRMFRSSPLLGTGLGTFGEVYPSFVPSRRETTYYAHNDYAQLLAEAGLVGAALLAVVFAILGRSFLAFRLSQATEVRGFNAGAWAALAGLAMHSLFDWNLHNPANAFLAAVVAGLAISSGGAATAAVGLSPDRSDRRWGVIGSRVAVISVCLVCCFLALRDAQAELVGRQLRQALVSARIARLDPKQPSPRLELLTALEAGERAIVWAGSNSDLPLRICHVNANLADRADDVFAVAAQQWFRRAQQECAVVLGEPAPLP